MALKEFLIVIDEKYAGDIFSALLPYARSFSMQDVGEPGLDLGIPTQKDLNQLTKAAPAKKTPNRRKRRSRGEIAKRILEYAYEAEQFQSADLFEKGILDEYSRQGVYNVLNRLKQQGAIHTVGGSAHAGWIYAHAKKARAA